MEKDNVNNKQTKLQTNKRKNNNNKVLYLMFQTDDADEKVPLVCSQRWILAYIGFLGFGVINALRVNISVAVVCMLKTINSTDMVLGVNTTESVDARCSQLEEMASIYDVSS